jgi:hypothetical protein
MKFLRAYHKWGGIILAFFLLIFSISGIIMNHRNVFSPFDISRSLLPKNYHYENWNLAAIKGGISTGEHYLLYGNLGIVKTDSSLQTFEPVHLDSKKGIDRKKTFKVIKSSTGRIYSASLSGLHISDDLGLTWIKIELAGTSHPVDISEYQGKIYVLTRSEVFRLNSESKIEEKIIPGTPDGYPNTIGLFRTLWEIHSGEFLGLGGKLLVDLMGLNLIFLSLSGLLYFVAPTLLRRMQGQVKKRFARINRVNLKWHNWIGLYAGFFLLMTTITGMFLRPPLLIPIANVEVGKLKYTHLDHPNPWYDKFRTLHINPTNGQVVLGTNEGIYTSDTSFSTVISPPAQPPVSVMGINVLEQLKGNNYLVGSFNGLYAWNPENGFVFDYLENEFYTPQPQRGSPISKNMVSGYFNPTSTTEILFDYNRGAINLSKNQHQWIEMPENLTNTPMSIWNLALELHTGRIFESILGDFYILFIPLAGLNILLLLVSGILVWFKHYHKTKSSSKNL